MCCDKRSRTTDTSLSPASRTHTMLSYKEYDNAQAVEIVLTGRVSTEEFDKIAQQLEAFIQRHGYVVCLK